MGRSFCDSRIFDFSQPLTSKFRGISDCLQWIDLSNSFCLFSDQFFLPFRTEFIIKNAHSLILHIQDMQAPNATKADQELKSSITKNLSEWSSLCHIEKEKLVILANGSAIFHNVDTKKKIYDNLVYCKMIGFNLASKNYSTFDKPPFCIDKYSCAFLIKHHIMESCPLTSNAEGLQLIQNIPSDPIFFSYEYLVGCKKFFLLDGHKFGSSFLAYQGNPDKNHAVYLVFVIINDESIDREQISRLAGICKKKALLIRVERKGSTFKLTEEQILPREGESRKTQQKESRKTEELLLLKKMIGY